MVAKKGTVEQTLPILVEVRRLLMERRSPLLRPLMDAVRETMRDYQDEVADILTDRQLASEIMYDLEQMKKEAAEAAERRRRGGLGGGPAGSPGLNGSLSAPSPRAAAGGGPTPARLSSAATPGKPTSLKDVFTPRPGSARSSGGGGVRGSGAVKGTPFSVPRLRTGATPVQASPRAAGGGGAGPAAPSPRLGPTSSSAANTRRPSRSSSTAGGGSGGAKVPPSAKMQSTPRASLGRATGAMGGGGPPLQSPLPSSLPGRFYPEEGAIRASESLGRWWVACRQIRVSDG